MVDPEMVERLWEGMEINGEGGAGEEVEKLRNRAMTRNYQGEAKRGVKDGRRPVL